jgi:ring-1,2-phenylacetyl-CoA epoxidase subunit PaaD
VVRARAYAAAASVVDPEVPCVTIADLGILRSVEVEGGVAVAKVTPTYSGCPAVLASNSIRALFSEAIVHCPQCGSENTSRVSEFGSTACKALYRCNACREPFDYFKCI